MTYEEFKKTCFHTRTRLKIPLLRTYIDKTELLDKKGRYDLIKEEKKLMKIYEENNLKNK